MLNFIATDLQLYNMFKITRVSFLAHIFVHIVEVKCVYYCMSSEALKRIFYLLLKVISIYLRMWNSVASPAMGHWGTCPPPRSLCKL